MVVRTSSISMLVPLYLGLLSLALVIVLASAFSRTCTFRRRSILQSISSAVRLARCLAAVAAALVDSTVRRESAANLVTIEVLLEDRARRVRTHRQARAILTRCIAAIGPPPANCAVLIVHRLERDGRRLSGCVERLTCTDGTIRTLIALAIETEPGAPSSDAIAARLASYYLIATGAKRTVLSADPSAPFPRPPTVTTTRTPSPEAISRIPLPIIVDGKRA